MSVARTVAGFTLVEVLVGLALTTLIATGLYSALFGVARAGSRSTAQDRANDEQRQIATRLRELLENSIPFVEGDGERAVALFSGARDHLRFVGHLPAHASGGGFQLIDLHANVERGRRRLELAFREAWPEVPFTGGASATGWTAEPLLEIDSIDIAYYGSRQDRARPDWAREWPTGQRRPELVKIEVTPAGRDPWPPLIVPLRVARSDAMPIWQRETPRK